MKQQTFSDIEYGGRKRITKRDEFLAIMNEIIPWQEWVNLIAPYYFTNKRGRPAIGIERMLRMFLLQAWLCFVKRMSAKLSSGIPGFIHEFSRE